MDGFAAYLSMDKQIQEDLLMTLMRKVDSGRLESELPTTGELVQILISLSRDVKGDYNVGFCALCRRFLLTKILRAIKSLLKVCFTLPTTMGKCSLKLISTLSTA